MPSSYSVRFASSYSYAGWKYYTVPAGRRAVVRHLAWNQLDATGGVFGVWMNAAWAFYRGIPAQNATQVQEVRFTAYAGEQIGFYTSHAAVTYEADGFLFNDSLTLREAIEEAEPGPPPIPAPYPVSGPPAPWDP